LRSFVEWRQGKAAAPPPYAIILTMDDGHRGNTQLQPVLARTGVPATVFLCGAIADSRRHFWWTKVKDPVEREKLKRLPDRDRLARLARSGFRETQEFPERQALSRDEIKQLQQVIDFQSHTRFHPVLPTCSDERARDEIAGAKAELESRFGLSIYALAYPNGDYSDRDAALAKESGYQCALTLEGGYNNADTDMYALKRIAVEDNAGSNELIVKASGLWDLIQSVLGRRNYRYSVAHRSPPASNRAASQAPND
jgi:peptidoglycan/xylan/chitin deacetylase (PgdA/CDA1 family)